MLVDVSFIFRVVADASSWLKAVSTAYSYDGGTVCTPTSLLALLFILFMLGLSTDNNVQMLLTSIS